MTDTKRIYLDYAASTPALPEVVLAMAPYWRDEYGNAGALHREGVAAKRVLENSRETVARLIDAHADEIVFTSGGTESNNLAIFGLMKALTKPARPDVRPGGKGKALAERHFVTSVIEHPSVLDCFKELEKEGAAVTYCPVTPEGLTDPKEIKKALRTNTALVSVAYVNNEIGSVNPVAEVAKVVRDHNKATGASAYFHTDASQAPLYFDCRVPQLGVDMLTIDAQKMYGPKGVGFLYVKRETPLSPIMIGGSQERGLRPGTPVIPLIAGMTKAFELADARREKEAERLSALRDHSIAEIEKRIPSAELNGSREHRTPNNVNFSFPGVDNEFLVLQLDAAGIAVGTRSACLSADGSGSYVIEALGRPTRIDGGGGGEYSKTSIRFTLGVDTTEADISRLVDSLEHLIPKT